MPTGTRSVALILSAVLAAIGAVPASGEGKYPDWDGQWRNPTGRRGGNPWGHTKPMAAGRKRPLTPEYQAIFDASLRDQADGRTGATAWGFLVSFGHAQGDELFRSHGDHHRPRVTYFVPLHYPAAQDHTDGRDRCLTIRDALRAECIGGSIDQDRSRPSVWIRRAG